MKATDLKYYIGIILIMVIGSLHSIYFENNSKYDVYLFYSHKRYLTNILFDISNLFNFSLLSYFLSRFNRKVFKPLFILSLATWVSYFLFYNQIGGLILIPIYILLIIYFKREWRKQ